MSVRNSLTGEFVTRRCGFCRAAGVFCEMLTRRRGGPGLIAEGVSYQPFVLSELMRRSRATAGRLEQLWGCSRAGAPEALPYVCLHVRHLPSALKHIEGAGTLAIHCAASAAADPRGRW